MIFLGGMSLLVSALLHLLCRRSGGRVRNCLCMEQHRLVSEHDQAILVVSVFSLLSPAMILMST